MSLAGTLIRRGSCQLDCEKFEGNSSNFSLLTDWDVDENYEFET